MTKTPSTDRIPTVSDCIEQADDARRRYDTAPTINGKLFWRAMEKSWRQTAELIKSAKSIDEFLEVAA